VLAVVVGLAGVKAWQIHALIAAGRAFVPPPETISAAVAHEEKWPDTLTAVGSISAKQGVTISPEIAGKVSEIAFESGAVVAQGDLLVRLDTSSEEAQLRAIEAQVNWPGSTPNATASCARTIRFRNPNWTQRRRCSNRIKPMPMRFARPSKRKTSGRRSPDNWVFD